MTPAIQSLLRLFLEPVLIGIRWVLEPAKAECRLPARCRAVTHRTSPPSSGPRTAAEGAHRKGPVSPRHMQPPQSHRSAHAVPRRPRFSAAPGLPPRPRAGAAACPLCPRRWHADRSAGRIRRRSSERPAPWIMRTSRGQGRSGGSAIRVVPSMLPIIICLPPALPAPLLSFGVMARRTTAVRPSGATSRRRSKAMSATAAASAARHSSVLFRLSTPKGSAAAGATSRSPAFPGSEYVTWATGGCTADWARHAGAGNRT